ncbi:MAG TPA: hypothetical protein VGL03_11675 [Thermoanaerobaculia bacterium]|jgi:hypothetical protein
MRALADAERIWRFLEALGDRAREEAHVYLAGGATAVLYGWRASTVDVDLKIVPDTSSLLQSIPELKEAFEINVELASPDDFIPALPGWEERSPFIARKGLLSFHHYDLAAQALAKIERGHEQDLRDAEEMVRRRLVRPADLARCYEQIEPSLYRYPAIDPNSFRRAVEEFLARQRAG